MTLCRAFTLARAMLVELRGIAAVSHISSELVALADSFIALSTELLNCYPALIEAALRPRLPLQLNRPCRALRIR